MKTYRIKEPDPETLARDRTALNAAVSELYGAFSVRRLSKGGPDACTSCCASPDAMARIASSSKHTITFNDLSEYHSAAKGEGAGHDLAYLLPRTMEFIAEGRQPESAGLFSLFAHYFSSMWSELNKREVEAVRSYCEALTRWRIGLSTQNSCNFTMSDILEMCASGGFDMEPILETLADPPMTTMAALSLADVLIHHADLWRDNGRGFYEVSNEQAASIAKALRKCLSSPKVLSLLQTAALSDDGDDLAEQASLAHKIAESLNVDDGGRLDS